MASRALKRIDINEWAPDLPARNHPSVYRLEDKIPVTGGWKEFPNDQVLTLQAGTNQIPNDWALAISDAIDTGTTIPHNVIATSSDLYIIDDTGTTNVSQGAGYIIVDDGWTLLQFNELMIAITPSAQPQQLDIPAWEATPTINFSDIAAPCPRARYGAIFKNSLVLGNLIVTGGAQRVQWSAQGDPTSWPTPGTDAAISVQAGEQSLDGDGGRITAVVSGGDLCAIFQERAIWRMDFVGGDLIAQFTRVEPAWGCAIPNLAIPFGREVLFWSRHGWRRFDYTTSVPVGEGKVDEFFKNDLIDDPVLYNRISTAVDPEDTKIYIAYPTTTNANFRSFLVYDYSLNRWGYGTESAISAVGSIIDPAEGIGGSEVSRPGRRILGCTTTQGGVNAALSSFNNFDQDLLGFIETGDLEISPGYLSQVTRLRLHGLDPSASLSPGQIDITKDIDGTTSNYSRNTYYNAMAKLWAVRDTARYHRFKFDNMLFENSGAESAQVDVYYTRRGDR